MPRRAVADVVERRLDEAEGSRYLDMRVDLMRCVCPLCDRPGRPPEHFLAAGGRWDRSAKAYVDGVENSRRLYLQDAQLDVGRWYARWLAARRRGEYLLGPDGTPCFTLGAVGGRRSGKTDFSPKAVGSYLLAFPRSIGWIVIPGYPDMPEIERELTAELPRDWYEISGGGEQSLRLDFENGSMLEVLSGRDPEKLKRGRADLIVVHEAQKQAEEVYTTVAGAAADRGGLVIVVGNPPKHEIGYWVEDFVDRARAGKTDEVVFELDPRLNPHVQQVALDALAKRMDERTFRRERLGEFLSREDVVCYSFSPSPLYGNVREVGRGPAGEVLRDVTRTYVERKFGRPGDRVWGIDFGKADHMAAAPLRFYEDPEDRDGDPLSWWTDCLLIEQGAEDDLVDAIEAGEDDFGRYTGDDPFVIDASGEWQNPEKTKGRTSADRLRARGLRRLYLPDAVLKRNPDISERVKVMNGRFKALVLGADGKPIPGPDGKPAGRRKAFVDPRVDLLVRTFKYLNNIRGAPNKHSEYIHRFDCASYPMHRLYPRRAPVAPLEFKFIPRPKRGGWEDL